MPPEYEFPKDDDDAAERAAAFRNVDPFKSIPPALLSSAEIYDYVRDTGMLHPFFPDDLKSASYEAYLGGRFIMWDETGKRIDKQLKRGDPCRLPANSIAFVQVEPRFRLPYYIALRFNLRITHVHRGLLLGTGPLVDPGFYGQLLIPLHNLTASDYEIDTTKALIWIEFTKTSFGFEPTEETASYPRRHTEFPPEKTNLTPETYLQKASGGEAIRSSIPDVIQQSKAEAGQAATSATKAATSANEAKNAAEKAERTSRTIGFAAVFAIVIALTAIVLQVSSLVQDSYSLSTSVAQEMNSLTANTGELEAQVKELQSDLVSTQNQVIATESDNDALELRLFNLEKDISDLRRAAKETARPQQ